MKAELGSRFLMIDIKSFGTEATLDIRVKRNDTQTNQEKCRK